MGEWKKAKVQLEKTEFPHLLFKNYVDYYNKMDEDKKIFAGVTKYKGTHKVGKNSHLVSNIRISNLFSVNGFKVEAKRVFCMKCNRTVKEQMAIFNNEENVCFVSTRRKEVAKGDSDFFNQ